MIQLAGPNPKFSMDPGHAPNTDFARQEPHDFKAIGSAFRVLQLNVEDLSTAKRQIIVTIAQHHKVDIICLQETHVADLTAGRYDIDGYDLPSAAPDVKYGRTTYTRSSISGFRQGRSTSAIALIVNGFQKNLKTGVVFLDLTAAYSVAHGAAVEDVKDMSKVLPWWFMSTIEVFLCNRRF